MDDVLLSFKEVKITSEMNQIILITITKLLDFYEYDHVNFYGNEAVSGREILGLISCKQNIVGEIQRRNCLKR